MNDQNEEQSTWGATQPTRVLSSLEMLPADGFSFTCATKSVRKRYTVYVYYSSVKNVKSSCLKSTRDAINVLICMDKGSDTYCHRCLALVHAEFQTRTWGNRDFESVH